MLYCLWSCECGSSSSAHPLMSRRPAVRPTSDATSLTSHSLPFLHHQSEVHLLTFQLLPHSFARTPGRHQVRFPNSVDSSQPSNLPTFNALSPLEATLIDDLRVLPEISRNRPPATPAKSTLTRNSRCNPFRRNTYKKPRGPRASAPWSPRDLAALSRASLRHTSLPLCLLFLYAGFMLDEKDFQRKADAAFEELKKRLLTLGDAHGFDVEGESGKLEVIFEEPEEMKFVISPNTPVREIWISALSTSFKLGWSASRSAFVLEKTGEDLFAVMSRVVSQQLGEQVNV